MININGRKRKVHHGKQGAPYIIKKGKKVYLSTLGASPAFGVPTLGLNARLGNWKKRREIKADNKRKSEARAKRLQDLTSQVRDISQKMSEHVDMLYGKYDAADLITKLETLLETRTVPSGFGKMERKAKQLGIKLSYVRNGKRYRKTDKQLYNAINGKLKVMAFGTGGRDGLEILAQKIANAAGKHANVDSVKNAKTLAY